MKKIFVFYILFCLVIASVLIIPNKKLVFADIGKINNSGQYYFYVKGDYKLDKCLCISSGCGTIIQTKFNNATQTKKLLDNIQGESYCFKTSNENITNEILTLFNAVIIKQQEIDNLKIVYAYSNGLEKYVKDDGEKINLQICINNENVTIGYPIILGSY